MLYESFRIKNFKGVHDTEIDFNNNRIITLVGLNESGKTSVMEAMNLFYTMIKGDEPETSSLNSFRPKGTDFTGFIIIKSALTLEKSDIKKIENFWKKNLNKRGSVSIPEKFEYTFKFQFKLHEFVRTHRQCSFDIKSVKAKTKTLYETDEESWQKVVKFIKEELVPEILYYDDFIFEIPESIYFVRSGQPEHDKAKTSNNKVWQSVLDDVLKSSNPQFNFQQHIVDVWDSDNDSSINRLSAMETALNEKITSRWSNLFGSDKINFTEIKILPKPSGNSLELIFKIKTESGDLFSVNERSKGFKWFFSFLLFTEFRKSRTKNILFLLDEPASNLHSSAQKKIIEAINDLSQESLVIYSTHSHHLINPEWLDGAYICINESVSEEQLSGNLNTNKSAKIEIIKYFTYVGSGRGSDKVSYFQPILDRLDYKPSFIEPIPKITILEGKNDFYAFQYFSKLVLEEEYEFNFYPGSGANKLWDIIRLYLAWGSEFIVLLDGDQAGVDAKKLYEDEFEDFVKGRIFTFAEINKVSGPIEDVILDPDKENIIDEVFGHGSFNKVKSNKNKTKKTLASAIMKLLLDNKKVAISKDTQDNFSKIFEKIKEYFG